MPPNPFNNGAGVLVNTPALFQHIVAGRNYNGLMSKVETKTIENILTTLTSPDLVANFFIFSPLFFLIIFLTDYKIHKHDHFF